MNANDKIAEPRSGNSSLVRPRYTPGLMLQDDDLTQAVTYTRELNRLLFRSLLGCGVVCGLVVKRDERCGRLTITVEPGVALDCVGDAIHITAPQSFVLDPTCKPLPESICVVVRHRERSCLPRTSSCGGDADSGSPATRINESWELKLLRSCPDCGCSCAPPAGATAPSPPVPEAAPPAHSVEFAEAAPPAQPKAKGKRAAEAAGLETARSQASVQAPPPPPQSAADCRCIDMRDIESPACYSDHYKGTCSCCVDCEWVTLARVFQTYRQGSESLTWEVDHSVRRLIRPVLMRDWQAEQDQLILRGPNVNP